MKNLNLLFLLISFILITSCTPLNYYQVYNVNADKNVKKSTEALVYEDQNCKVMYNLWDENGDIGFSFYNKTDKTIHLDLERSFFILNGIAFQYFQNRIFSESSSNNLTIKKASYYSATVNTLKSEYGIDRIEQKTVAIPSKTQRIINEFSINDNLIRDCGLFKYPNRKEINSITFNESNSPIKFSNRLTYSLENSVDLINFENSFYVSRVTNYPDKEMFESKYDEFCGQKATTETKYFKYVGPDKFYIMYSKGVDTWKH